MCKNDYMFQLLTANFKTNTHTFFINFGIFGRNAPTKTLIL